VGDADGGPNESAEARPAEEPIGEPGDASDDLYRPIGQFEQAVSTDFVSTDASTPCEPWTGRPRPVGDWHRPSARPPQ
jgi:hypothetical protein